MVSAFSRRRSRTSHRAWADFSLEGGVTVLAVIVRRLRFFGQWNKLKADGPKEA